MPDIPTMLAEIESSYPQNCPQQEARILAQMELQFGNPPNMAYVHNILAMALGQPLQVKNG